MTIADNIAAVRARIEAAAERGGRDPAAVRLIGVVKGTDATAISAAIDAGLVDVGENFVQEAAAHREALGDGAAAARWHFIGHLQTNKVPVALRLFDILESVDSVRLAEQIDRKAIEKLPVLLEVNLAAEASKFGLAPRDVDEAVAALRRLQHVEPVGLMAIAPAAADPQTLRPLFRTLRDLASANDLPELSMGMTDDYEVAIEEGATIVRIGRAIFGERR